MSDHNDDNTPISARLLLVDDQPANLITLKAILEPLGQELVLARSGTEALKHLLTGDFAVILLDVQMPDMDGFETAALMRQRERSRYIPIIFLTASHRDEEFITRAYSAGAVDFLYKPYHPEMLKSKVMVFVDLFIQREKIKQQAMLLNESMQRESRLQQAVREQEQEQRYLRELNRRESEKVALSREVEEMARRQRLFLREVLSSLTEGRLHLCDATADLPSRLGRFADPIPLTIPTLRNLRKQIASLAEETDLPLERIQDLETAVGEAAMNAVVHGKNATGQIFWDRDLCKIQVWIQDQGEGISEDSLHRATLERGFTTKGTLGHGFWMMLKTADRVYLLTGKGGTTVVIEEERTPPLPLWLQVLPAYDFSASAIGTN